ncbi:MAG: cytochrome c3 family protein [Anaerolineae bacterium]|nr:cytochrome c3 family protein [Anaerolineae bacterium]
MTVAGLISAAVLLLNSQSTFAQGDDYARRPPIQCRRCHPDAYETWTQSTHALAYADDTFQGVWERERQQPECLECHSPGYDAAADRMVYEGIGCAACHHTIDPTRREFDNSSYHGKMSVIDTAEGCSGCHGEDHARTYREWKTSPHNGARTVQCLDCHQAHSGELTAASALDLCGACHLKEPSTASSPHMHIDSGCTDCHPAPVHIDNVHMRAGIDPVATCVDCHMSTQRDQWGHFLTDAGHSLGVSLTACTDCHGSLHEMQAGAAAP